MKIKSAATRVGALVLFCVISFFTACQHETPAPTQPPQGIQPTLSSIQANIFTPKCVNAGCHPGGGAPMSLASGQSYNTLVGAGGTGVTSSGYAPLLRVSPGNAANSVLYLKVAGNTLGNIMPLGRPPLSAAEVTAIQTWINNGAQNN
ncbi:hypothetical protein HUU05_30640 [candidate division KSB1 bacterium]|nr:hypothetical protein [candidate division KSB1 bacterium]